MKAYMKRSILVFVAVTLMTACYHDNASPFVHGAAAKPMEGTNTMVPATSSASDEATTTVYDASSGRSGGVRQMPTQTETSK